ncbi:hypothetical protein BDN72DRAFT_214532 [Pluteus cervinus]|uniref:Uncharacterized protein n=1 Tax=Pluteus cervinus TaxID=181527 RepID=A0ACD3B5D5_9AGAR|nr:hypothetical protein BDN72DRAFT_214532 [Pluteus cervinus]
MTSSVNFMLTSELTTMPNVLSINVDVAQALQKHSIFKESTNTARVGFDHPRFQSSLPRSKSSYVVQTQTVPRSPPTPSFKDPKNAERRLRRYSDAQEALSSSLRRCSTGPSPQDLQIRTLEKATSILSAHAEEARERAAQLRQALVHKDIDPETHKDLKRQRWMEERRQQQVDAESRAVSGVLVSLRQHSPSPSLLQTQPTPPPTDSEARRRANLSKFFASSGKRASLPSPRSSLLVERRTKRMTMADVSPMKLRTSFTAADSIQFPRTHLRSRSLDTSPAPVPLKDNRIALRSRVSALPTAAGVAQTPPLSAVTEDPSIEEQEQEQEEDHSSTAGASSSVSAVPALAPPSATASVTEADSTHCPTPPAAIQHMLPPHIVNRNSFSSMGGTAIIFSPTERSDEEIFAELGDVEVLIPEYAKDLINKFGVSPRPLPPATPATLPRQANVSILTPTPKSSPSPRSKHKSSSSLRQRASFLTGSSSAEDVASPKPSFMKKATSRRQIHSLFSEGVGSRLGSEGNSKSSLGSPTIPSLAASPTLTPVTGPATPSDRRRSRSHSPSPAASRSRPSANLAARWRMRISLLRPR